ncbi:MAG TPA: DUF1579 family protein [Polyangiaceae bacterium]|jgi:hypothetical protein
MEMPKAGPEHARLLSFVGEWEGPEELSATAWGPGGEAFGRMSFRADLDGFAVIQDYIEQKQSRITFRGHGVFTVDPQTKEILWYWFDSFGLPPEGPARGRFEADVLTMNRVSERGASRYTYRITANSCEFSIENKFPHEPDFKLFMKGKYSRKED